MPDSPIPTTLGGGRLKDAMEALFTAAHEHDADEWAMPIMLCVVTVEPLTDRGAVAVSARMVDEATDVLNDGNQPDDALPVFASMVRDKSKAEAREWLGFGEGQVVIGAALMAEMWTIPIPPNDPVAEAEATAWLAANGRAQGYHGAREVRALMGVDVFGYLYEVSITRGSLLARTEVLPLPGLAGPGEPGDLHFRDGLFDHSVFTSLGLTLTTLGRMTSPAEGSEW